MKAIHYDLEGDILSITFDNAQAPEHRGFELTDNIVLYYDAETKEPIQLLLLSYQTLLQESAKRPILFDGLGWMPKSIQKTIITVLKRAPLITYFELSDTDNNNPPTGRIREIFTPAALQMMLAQ